MLRTFILKADGAVSLSDEKSEAQPRLAQILELLERRNYTAEEVMPLIRFEFERAKTKMQACKDAVELDKHRRYVLGLKLVRDYVERTLGLFDPGEYKFDGTELKIVEIEVFRFLREVAFRDDRLMDVGIEQASEIKTFGEASLKYMIELIGDSTPFGTFKLLLWDGTQSFIQDHIGLKLKQGSDSGTIILGPPDVDPSARQAIRFPTRVAPDGTCQGLFDEICTLIKKFTDLAPKLVSLAAYSVLASWFPELTPLPVCVSIVGVPSYHRSNLFRLLGCLYRRPLLLGEMGMPALYSLPMELCPALFGEQCESNAQLQKVFRASSAPDIFTPWKGRFLHACCAKVVCTEDPLENEGIGQGAVEIPITPTRQSLPILEKCVQEEITDEFQSKLLRFRLTNYNQVRNSKYDVAQFESSARGIARSLGMCVSGEPKLQEAIPPLLKARNEELRADLECSQYLNRFVAEAMLFFCHEEGSKSLYVREITSQVNFLLKKDGEMLTLTPKQVGNKLKAMGITTKRLNAMGRGIQLLSPIRQRIHRLARDLCFDFRGAYSDLGSPTCPHCEQDHVREGPEPPDPLDSLSDDELGDIIG